MNYYEEVNTEMEYLLQFYDLQDLHNYAGGSIEKIRQLYIDAQPIDVPIGEIMNDHNNDDYAYMVDSPDGWVPVVDCFEKTKEDMYIVELNDGTTIRASHDHLFQKPDMSWWFTRDLAIGDKLLTKSGVGVIQKLHNYQESTKVYDLSVDHPNHRYYTDDVCSHNSGKSLFLQNHSVNFWKSGLNVLQITLELNPMLVARRMDCMFLNMSVSDLYADLPKTNIAIKAEKAKHNVGDMRVKYMPSGSTTAEIKNLVKMYMNDTKKRVDVLVVDYLDLVNPIGKFSTGDTFNKDKLVSEELRNIGQELGPIVLTASQLNRSAVGAQSLDHSNIAGGLSKINTADLVFGIITSDAMRENGQYELQALKVRNGTGTGRRIELLVNENTMRIKDDPDYIKKLPTYMSMSPQDAHKDKESTEITKQYDKLNSIIQSNNSTTAPKDSPTGEVGAVYGGDGSEGHEDVMSTFHQGNEFDDEDDSRMSGVLNIFGKR